MKGGLDPALWRAVALFRGAALLYAAVSLLAHVSGYAHPWWGVGVLGGMAAWTVFCVVRPPGPALLGADLLVALAAQQLTVLVLTAAAVDRGDPTLAVSWAACPVVAWAVLRGPWWGGAAGLVIAAGAVVERQGASQATVNSGVLLLLAGVVIGYVVRLARRAEVGYAEAVRRAAQTAERERLAREVHDGVLQTLALVARGEGRLALLAGEQERALRRLVSGPAVVAPGVCDLRPLLPAEVELAAPAAAVLLPAAVAQEVAAAVGAAVDNAHRHAGGRVFVLVEDEPAAVTVTVRDSGPGIPAGRLDEAVREGRMGLARSVRGRVEQLGGRVSVSSSPAGTEVEICVPH